MQRRRLPSPIPNTDFDQKVFRGFFRVFHKHIEIVVPIEHACIQQFVLKLVPRSVFVCGHQFVVRIFPLRIFVQVLHVGMGRRAVQVEVILFHILAVVPFAVGQSKQPFF